MKILLDTHCWLWSLVDPGRLSTQARDLFVDSRNELYLSAVSSLEIAIKSGIGRLTLPESPGRYVPSRMEAQGILALPIEHAHALRLAELPVHHRDPFDRLLVAQAQLEKMKLLSADPQFRAYDVELLWAG